MSGPRVSVVIPNYNHARLLPTSLGAVLRQTRPADEVLVLDDASTDDSRKVLDGFAREHPRLRLCTNEKNLGVVATMNRGLELATGDYVAFLAADDEVLTHWLERAVPMLERHPGVGLVCGLTEWRCQTTGMRWQQGVRMPREAVFLRPAEMAALGRRGALSISGQHALFRREALVAAGGWRPELRWFTDWFGTCVVGFRLGMCHVPEVLSIFNLHATSYYNRAQSRQRQETMDRILQLLESEAYADVAPWIGASGLLGGFGWPMLRLVAGRRAHRRFFTAGFARQAARNVAEGVGRRFFPRWLAELCLRLFYRRREGGRIST